MLVDLLDGTEPGKRLHRLMTKFQSIGSTVTTVFGVSPIDTGAVSPAVLLVLSRVRRRTYSHVVLQCVHGVLVTLDRDHMRYYLNRHGTHSY